MIRWGGVDLSPSVSRPPEHWKSSQKKQNVGDYLRAYSAWICAKPALWIFFSTRKALWASVHSRTGMIDSGIIQTCQERAKIVELEKKKMFCDLCESQRVFSIFFSNWTCLLKTWPFSMRWTEPVIFLYWVGPVPYLELLGRDQSKKHPVLQRQSMCDQ